MALKGVDLYRISRVGDGRRRESRRAWGRMAKGRREPVWNRP